MNLQAFRDALSESYRSSKQFKQQRRQDVFGTEMPGNMTGFDTFLSTTSLLQTFHGDSRSSEVLPALFGSSSSKPSGSLGFSSLLSILEETVDFTVDPFEPTPISPRLVAGGRDQAVPTKTTSVGPTDADHNSRSLMDAIFASSGFDFESWTQLPSAIKECA
jgi:hypothetical protein